MKKIIILSLVIICIIIFTYMNHFTKKSFGIFTVTSQEIATMNGDITTKTPKNLQKMLRKYPQINQIVMEECPGSDDDDAVFEAGRIIRNQKIRTYLPSHAVIESGAVEFFLAGYTRYIEPGAQIGVHTWEDEDTKKFATDFPKIHKEHIPYIKYYKEMNNSDDFYFFTIEAAEYDSMYFLTENDIKRFNLRKEIKN